VSRRLLHDERGMTLTELLVAMLVGTIILGAIVTLVTTTSKTSGRITERVAANQLARPMMQRVINEMHSACISPGLAPVLPGSNSDAISFIHGTGPDVAPTPVKRTIAFDSGTGYLTDQTFEETGGAAPDWTFSSTPSATYRLLEHVSGIDTATPIFSYYAYENGAISQTPLPVPLSSDDADRTVEVTIALAVSPTKSATSDEEGAPIELTNSALLRFSPSNEDTEQAGLPCT
jgi:prepilin-type N-terminal cleavage/methylation domain-containing protein